MIFLVSTFVAKFKTTAMENKKLPLGKEFSNFVIFKTETGKINIDVFFQNDTLWLTQKKLRNFLKKGEAL